MFRSEVQSKSVIISVPAADVITLNSNSTNGHLNEDIERVSRAVWDVLYKESSLSSLKNQKSK